MREVAARPGAAVRGVLFDKDGTLVDFRATWLPAFLGVTGELATAVGAGPALAGELLRRLGYDPEADAFGPASPLLWATNATIAAAWSAQPEIAGRIDVVEVVERHFTDSTRYPPQPVGDVAALLARLGGRGLKVGLATMDSTAQAHATARLLGIDDRLDFVTGSDGGFGLKPEPGMVLGFCAACGLLPGEVVMVGDTTADLLMARSAGCRLAVAVRTGATPAHVLTTHADHVLADIHGLEDLLEGLVMPGPAPP